VFLLGNQCSLDDLFISEIGDELVWQQTVLQGSWCWSGHYQHWREAGEFVWVSVHEWEQSHLFLFLFTQRRRNGKGKWRDCSRVWDFLPEVVSQSGPVHILQSLSWFPTGMPTISTRGHPIHDFYYSPRTPFPIILCPDSSALTNLSSPLQSHTLRRAHTLTADIVKPVVFSLLLTLYLFLVFWLFVDYLFLISSWVS